MYDFYQIYICILLCTLNFFSTNITTKLDFYIKIRYYLEVMSKRSDTQVVEEVPLLRV